MKKILIVIIVLLLIIVGGLWWYIHSTSSISVNTPTASSSPVVPFPVASDRAISVIPQSGTASSSSFVNGQEGSSTDTASVSEFYSRPVLGYHFLTIATSSVFVFMDRDSGNLYATKKEGAPQRITNTTLLGIERLWWVESKDRLYTIIASRGDGVPQTTVYSVKKSEISSSLSASSSPTSLTKEGVIDGNIIDMSPSPAGSKIFLLSKGGTTGESTAEILDITTLKRTLLLTHFSLTEVSTQWISLRTVLLSTKPSFYAPGALFTIDTSTGALKRLLGGNSNFSSLSDTSAENILYTDGSQSKIKSTKATSTQILSLSAIPEKCVWSKDFKGLLYCAIPHDQGEFLLQHDAWLRGEYSTHDDLWWMDTRNGTADKLLGFSAAVDAEMLALDPLESSVIIKNRVTGTLLSIPIPQETSD